jgi:4-nitrophenyl phosphatase
MTNAKNLQPFHLQIRGVILDLDGTLLRGDEPLPGLSRLFSFLYDQQVSFIIATNNATKSPQVYQQKLAACGVWIKPANILTSALATADYLQSRLSQDTKLYVIGQPALHAALQEAGFIGVEDTAEPVSMVVVGGDPTLTYDKLKKATLFLQRGAELVGTNPDVVYPTEEGLVPETGTTLAALEAASGVSPVVIGKPAPYLFMRAVDILGSVPSETLVVGDRLETDILGGQQAGLKTILITTGVDRESSISEKDIHPDWSVNSLDELIELLSQR